MFALKVSVADGSNLNTALDQVLDGALDHLLKLDEVRADEQGAGLFAAQSKSVFTFEVTFPSDPTPELRAQLLAAMRKIVGPEASIQEIDERGSQ